MSRASATVSGLTLGGEPRVELLPAEVGANKQARSTRRMLVMLLVVVLVIVAAGYGFAVFRNGQASADLVSAQGRTGAIQVERQKYAAVTTTAQQISDIDAARTLGASTEVLWLNLMNSIQASLPPGVSIVSATMKGRAPSDAELTPAGPLREQRVATLSLVITSPTIFDATAIVRSLVNVPGFADATPDTVTGGASGYSTTVTLNVNEKALSGRFAATEATK